MNVKLLEKCLKLQAESNNNEQQQAIFDAVAKMIPDNCTITYDTYGNMYIVKGVADIYPCVVAHVDQVHKYCADFNVIKTGDVFLAFDPTAGRQVGVGGDDKCGIYLTIRALQDFPACKVVLFKNEEVGCKGSAACNIDFFSDVSFIIQGDRKHNEHDCINHTNGVQTTSSAFEASAKHILAAHGYSFAKGSCTDIGELVCRDVGCCTMNLACGYFGAHTASEIVRVSLLAKCEEFMFAMFHELGHTRWEHKAEKWSYSTPFRAGGTWNGYNGQTAKRKALPPVLPGKCPLCTNDMTDEKHDAFCNSCGMYASDIAYWESQIKSHV